MHELAVTESILKTAAEYAEKSNAVKVTDINLVIGKLSSFVDDSISFYWDFVSKETICQGAALHFERPPARLLCQECNNEYLLDDSLTPCPICDSTKIKILSGDEFRIDSIQIELSQAPT